MNIANLVISSEIPFKIQNEIAGAFLKQELSPAQNRL